MAAIWKGFVLGVVGAFVIAATCIWLIVQQGFISAAAGGAHAPWLERWATDTSLRATLARDSSKSRNPVSLTEDNLIAGIKLYSLNCTICHGTAKAQARSPRGEYPEPPQWASEGVADDPPGWTFWKIKNGIQWTGMPAWQNRFDDREIWTITLFLAQMDKLAPAAEQVWREVRN